MNKTTIGIMKKDIYWIGRICDILTTWLAYSTPNDEWNLIMRKAMSVWGFSGFVFVNVALSLLLYLMLKKFKMKKEIVIMGILSLLVACWNLFWFLVGNGLRLFAI